jgi:eukaryotic-like serine/threonine-protein kinase
VKWILPIGSDLDLAGMSSTIHILRGLGSGSQGQVYEVAIQDQRAALKWYYPSCLRLDPELRERLTQCIRAGQPTDSFLWPLALLEGHQGLARHGELVSHSFGYLMNIRSAEFVPALEHYASRLQLTIATVLGTCLRLCSAFHALHSKGFCYKDISIANLFMDPNGGRILICDNDNVGIEGIGSAAVLGTPGFMAPEVLLRQARPGRGSDLFSLAVLLFRLLTRHDPFKGMIESGIECLDEQARLKLYGLDPVFIFHPTDQRNRPDPEAHSSALLTWPIYPRNLQDCFVQTFVHGLRDPRQRVMTGEWIKQFAATLDRRSLCPSCGQENFPDPPPARTHCWHCGCELSPSTVLECETALVTLAEGNQLHPHHFNRLISIDLQTPIGVVAANPNRPELIGLKNLSDVPWQAELQTGDVLTVPPGRSTNLALTASVRTSHGKVIVKKLG